MLHVPPVVRNSFLTPPVPSQTKWGTANCDDKQRGNPTTLLSFSQQVRDIGFAGQNEKSKRPKMIDPRFNLPAITNTKSGRKRLMLSYSRLPTNTSWGALCEQLTIPHF